MTGTHPDDADLFDYVEDDLTQRRRAELEVHLASCARCAEQVARVQAGRDALRETPLLQLSQSRRDAIFLDLPPQRRERRRQGWFSLKRVAAVAAPVAALVAIVVALPTLGGNGDESAAVGEDAAERAVSSTAASEAAGGGQEAPEDRATKDALLNAAGPASDVAAELRAEGFDAEVVNDHVEVRNATRAEVRKALQGRRDGRIRIVIVP